jgi:predicted ATP-grasp superfamily ATP-dependent carboligase
LPSQFRTLPYSEPMSTMTMLSKPRVSRGGRGVVVYEGDNRDEILLLDDHSIIQEFVPGTEYAPNLYCHANGEVTVVVLEKTALAQGRVGNAVSVQRVEAPDVAAVAVATVQLLGLLGPVDIDIRRRADGTPVVLEVNARLGANSAHAPEVLSALLQEVTPHYPTLFVTHEPAEQPLWMA